MLTSVLLASLAGRLAPFRFHAFSVGGDETFLNGMSGRGFPTAQLAEPLGKLRQVPKMTILCDYLAMPGLCVNIQGYLARVFDGNLLN